MSKTLIVQLSDSLYLVLSGLMKGVEKKHEKNIVLLFNHHIYHSVI